MVNCAETPGFAVLSRCIMGHTKVVYSLGKSSLRRTDCWLGATPNRVIINFRKHPSGKFLTGKTCVSMSLWGGPGGGRTVSQCMIRQDKMLATTPLLYPFVRM